MNNNTIMENYLLVLKSNVEVFVHGTLESSFTDNQELLKKCLLNTIDCQRRTYELMTDMGIYQVEKVKPAQISSCINKLTSNN